VRAGTPEEVRKKLEDTLKKVVNDPEVKSKLQSMGLTPRFIDGKQYGEIVIRAVKSVPELIQYSKKAQEG
jgi:tripartite-type tricarboxylate transporter receptor subunit TctC